MERREKRMALLLLTAALLALALLLGLKQPGGEEATPADALFVTAEGAEEACSGI